jgi:hypothetical protein
MQILYAMILVIDVCNAYADISGIIANGVILWISSSVPYSVLNE